MASWRHGLTTLLVALALVCAASAVATVTTLVHARRAERVESRSVVVVAVVASRVRDRVLLDFHWGNGTQRSRAPVGRSHRYFTGISYPVVVDPKDPSSVRMAAEPFDAVGPIVGPWLCAGALALVLAGRVARQRLVAHRCAGGPVRPMVASSERVTPRSDVVTLAVEGDPQGAHRGIVLFPRRRGTGAPKAGNALAFGGARAVTVWGTLDSLDTPLIVIDGVGYVPRARLLFGDPLSSRQRRLMPLR